MRNTTLFPDGLIIGNSAVTVALGPLQKGENKMRYRRRARRSFRRGRSRSRVSIRRKGGFRL